MEAEGWALLIASGGLITGTVALVIAGLAKKEARRAADAAERSANADEVQVGLAQAEADKCGVRLGISKERMQKHVLMNRSYDEPATDITLAGNFIALKPKRVDVLKPGSGIPVTIARVSTSDTTVTVSWSCPRKTDCPSAPHERSIPV